MEMMFLTDSDLDDLIMLAYDEPSTWHTMLAQLACIEKARRDQRKNLNRRTVIEMEAK